VPIVRPRSRGSLPRFPFCVERGPPSEGHSGIDGGVKAVIRDWRAPESPGFVMTKNSRELEILVTKIQKQLAPKAEVLHNVMLDGRNSKIKRQIDVLVRERVGQYEIQIIIDCKDYNRPVDIKAVEEFYGTQCDVGAQKGVLVCPKGFTAAAKTRAAGLQIDLYSPFDTDAHKWQVKATIPQRRDVVRI
jgi:hypothetical protein